MDASLISLAVFILLSVAFAALAASFGAESRSGFAVYGPDAYDPAPRRRR